MPMRFRVCVAAMTALWLPRGASAQDITESVAADGGDVTEAVQSSGAPAFAMAPVEPPLEPASQASLHGWLRQSLEWTLHGYGASGASSDPANLVRDRLLSHTQLLIEGHYRLRSFEAGVSGLLTLSVHELEPANGAAFRGLNGQGAYARVEPDLRELYVGESYGPLDLRIGQQRVVWGHSYAFSPNDVVNAHDLRDPMLGEPELRGLPTPLLRADLALGPVNVQAVVSPVLVPDRFDLYDSNWSPIGLDTPVAYRGFLNVLASAVDPSLRPNLQQLLRQTKLPEPFTQATSGGVRVSSTLLDVDVSAYYHYGFDTTPAVQVDPSFAYVLAGTDFAHTRLFDLAPALRAVDAGLSPLRAEYVRRHHVGLDLARAIGPFLLRLEAAYETARVFYALDMSSYVSPALLFVAGLEYQPGALDQLVALELVYVALLELPRTPLIAYAAQSYGVAAIVRWPLFGVLSLNLRAIAGIERPSYVLQPALRIGFGGLLIDVGVLLLDGESLSFGWVFRRNAAAFAQARYAF
jgi:hypothetical protein